MFIDQHLQAITEYNLLRGCVSLNNIL